MTPTEGAPHGNGGHNAHRTAVAIRPVEVGDLDSFFANMQDATALWMAAFTPPDPSDREAFDAHWERLLTDDAVVACTVLVDRKVVGNVASFLMDGTREITYWIARGYWGRGVASEALAQFLRIDTTRPLHGVAAADNRGSIRTMEKCGFVHAGRGRAFSTARNENIDEVTLVLE